MTSKKSNDDSGCSGTGGRYYHLWRDKCDRLEKENRILRATNKHLKTLLSNAHTEIDSLKNLVSELEESCQDGGIIPNLHNLRSVKQEDSQEGNGGPLSLLPEEVT